MFEPNRLLADVLDSLGELYGGNGFHVDYITKATAEIKRLREVLKPFAVAADELMLLPRSAAPEQMYLWKAQSNVREYQGITAKMIIDAKEALEAK